MLGNLGNHPVIQTIQGRRSVRKYLPQQLPKEVVAEIVEAGRYAPSGGNNQYTHFIVVRNSEALSGLKALVTQEFLNMEITEGMYQSLKNAIVRAKQGKYDFLYGAPTFVIAANRMGYGNAVADCACALENMMLAACALEVGSCWINQLRWLNENPAVVEYAKGLGLHPEEEIILGGLALGYQDGTAAAPLARRGNPVTWVE